MTITAPAPRTRTRGASRTPARGRTSLAPSTPTVANPADRGRARSAAAQRAYARRAERQATLLGERLPTPAGIARRAPFVLAVMLLLAAGLVASLWLTTAAAADSYRLEQARLEARDLTERSEQLRQEVATLETAPELARRAQELGMVPVGQPAVLAVQPDGSVVVVGEPEAAEAPAPPEPPAPPAPAPEQVAPPADPAAGDSAVVDPAAQAAVAPAPGGDG